MPTITSSAFAKSLWPGVKTWFGHAYKEHSPEWNKLVDVEKSSKAFEEDVSTRMFGLASVKDEGAPIQYDDMSQEFVTRYIHTVYALGFIITREAHEDALEGGGLSSLGSVGSKGLAYSMRQTKETVVANLYNRAFDSNYVGGDGLEMCSVLHLSASGTQSNELNPAADLSEAALEDACILISKFVDSRGLNISARPKCLVIPVDLEFIANRILNSSLRVDTANNDLNSLKAMGKIPKVETNHYLDDTNNWFIRTNVANGPKLYQRRRVEFRNDSEFDTENAKYKATERYSTGWSDWRGILGSEAA